MVEGGHAGEANSVGHLPVCLPCRIVTDTDHAGLSMCLPKLRRGGIHIFRIHNIMARNTVTTGALRSINVCPRFEYVLTGAEGRRFNLAVDTGIHGQPDDLLFIRKRRIGDGHRERAKVKIQEQTGRYSAYAENKTQKNLTNAATTAFFCHRMHSLTATRPGNGGGCSNKGWPQLVCQPRPPGSNNSKAQLVQE